MRYANAMFAVATTVSLGAIVCVAQDGPKPTTQPTSALSQTRRTVYRPPSRGFPSEKLRVGGGTRSSTGELPRLWVIAPAEGGLTARPDPALIWYQDKGFEGRYIFTLNDEAQKKCLLQVLVIRKETGGFHCLDLKALGVTLKPEVPYSWWVGVTSSESHTSNDPAAVGAILFVPPKQQPKQAKQDLSANSRAAAWGQAGYWYDAAMELIPPERRGSESAELKPVLLDMLRDGGLNDVANMAEHSVEAVQP